MKLQTAIADIDDERAGGGGPATRAPLTKLPDGHPGRQRQRTDAWSSPIARYMPKSEELTNSGLGQSGQASAEWWK